jgi:hypothetical protein
VQGNEGDHIERSPIAPTHREIGTMAREESWPKSRVFYVKLKPATYFTSCANHHERVMGDSPLSLKYSLLLVYRAPIRSEIFTANALVHEIQMPHFSGFYANGIGCWQHMAIQCQLTQKCGGMNGKIYACARWRQCDQ